VIRLRCHDARFSNCSRHKNWERYKAAEPNQVQVRVAPVALEGGSLINAVGTGIESSDARSPFAICVCLDLVSPSSAIDDWRMATLRILRDRSNHSKSINSTSLKSSGACTQQRCNQTYASFSPRREHGFIETTLTHLSSRRIANDLSSREWATLGPGVRFKCWPAANQCLPGDEKEPRLPIILATNRDKTRHDQRRDLTEIKNNNVAILFVDTPPPNEDAGG